MSAVKQRNHSAYSLYESGSREQQRNMVKTNWMIKTNQNKYLEKGSSAQTHTETLSESKWRFSRRCKIEWKPERNNSVSWSGSDGNDVTS